MRAQRVAHFLGITRTSARAPWPVRTVVLYLGGVAIAAGLMVGAGVLYGDGRSWVLSAVLFLGGLTSFVALLRWARRQRSRP